MEDFKYVGVSIMRWGRLQRETDIGTGVACAVMRILYQSTDPKAASLYVSLHSGLSIWSQLLCNN